MSVTASSIAGNVSGAGSKRNMHSHIPAERLVKHVAITVSSLVFATLLVIIYQTFTVAHYAYMGYEWNPAYVPLAVGLLAVCISSCFLPTNLTRPGDLFLYQIFVFAYVPAMVLPSTYSPLTQNHLLLFQAVLVACFLMLVGANWLPLMRIDLRILTLRQYDFAVMSGTLFLLAILVVYLGVPTAIPGFGDVYTVRLQSREALANSPFFVAYVYGLVARVIGPFAIIYGLQRRNKLLALIGLGSVIYLYALTGSKGLLFTVGLMAVLFLGYRLLRNMMLLLILPGAILVILGARIMDYLMSSLWYTALLGDRVFIIPGVLTGYYHEFFTTNGYGYWGYSFLSWATDYKYDRTPAFLVGHAYYGSSDTQANAHFWVDGLANFGYPGLVIVTLLVAVILWFYNSLSLGRPFVLMLVFSNIILRSLLSDSVFTSILTHGLFYTTVLLILMPAKSAQDELDPESSPQEIASSERS